MPINYGNPIAKYVETGIAKVGPSTWIRLVATGTAPLSKRQWIEIQPRGGGALAIAYTNVNSDGSFTAPGYSAQGSKIIPAKGVLKGEPLSDTVMMWGRFVAKDNTSHGGLKVIVTEYA